MTLQRITTSSVPSVVMAMSKDEIRAMRTKMAELGFKFTGRSALAEQDTPHLEFRQKSVILQLTALQQKGVMTTQMSVNVGPNLLTGNPDQILEHLDETKAPKGGETLMDNTFAAVEFLAKYCGKQKVSSSTQVESLVKPDSAYQWFTYTGKPLDMMSGVGTPLYLKKGQVFGVRKSASGKKIRMITEDLGPTKVFTLLPEVAMDLAKHCTPASGPVTAAATSWTLMPTEDELDMDSDDDPRPKGYPKWADAADDVNGVFAFCGQAIITFSPDEKLMVQVGSKGLREAEKSNTFTRLPKLLEICSRLGLPPMTAAQFSIIRKEAL